MNYLKYLISDITNLNNIFLKHSLWNLNRYSDATQLSRFYFYIGNILRNWLWITFILNGREILFFLEKFMKSLKLHFKIKRSREDETGHEL